MNEQPNIPFMPVKGRPPIHLRDLTPEELLQHQRMLRDAELRARLSGINTRVAVKPASK